MSDSIAYAINDLYENISELNENFSELYRGIGDILENNKKIWEEIGSLLHRIVNLERKVDKIMENHNIQS